MPPSFGGTATALDNDSVAVIDFVLDDLRRKPAKMLGARAKAFVEIVDLDGSEARCGALAGKGEAGFDGCVFAV